VSPARGGGGASSVKVKEQRLYP